MAKYIVRVCGYGTLLYFVYQETRAATVVFLVLIALGAEIYGSGIGAHALYLKGKEWAEKHNIK